MPIIPFTMEARKLLYTAMAVAPVVLMAGIGVYARTYQDPFEWTDSSADHRRISAYIPYIVQATERAWRRSPGAETKARHLAKMLIDGEKSGKLQPLVPITADELNPHGHKATVYEMATLVARFLIHTADEQMKAGNYRDATTNLVLASDSLSPLKYSEFTSLFRCTLQQGNILHRFRKMYPVADEKARGEMTACMTRMKGDRKEFIRIAKNAKRVLLESLGRQQTMEEAVLTASSLVPEPSFFEQPALAKERDPFANSAVNTTLAVPVPNQRIEATQCVLADERNRAMIQQITAPSSKPTTL